MSLIPNCKGVILPGIPHTGGVLVDFLLIILRDLLHRHATLRVVLMSATLDAAVFADYFGNECPVLSIPGFTFPVTTHYLEETLALTKYSPDRSGPQQPRTGDPRKQGAAKNATAVVQQRALTRVPGGTEWHEFPVAIRQKCERIDDATAHDRMDFGLLEALLLHLMVSDAR